MTLREFILNIKISDVISILALMISGISIFWNVYRDIVLKAKLRIIVQISDIVQSDKKLGTFILIGGTNHGPGSIICESIWLQKKYFWGWVTRKSRFAFLVHDYTNPLSNTLPKKLEVGENLTLLFPYKEGMFLATRPTHVGIKDSFGRLHWAKSKSLKEAIEKYLKIFPEQEWGKQDEKRR